MSTNRSSLETNGAVPRRGRPSAQYSAELTQHIIVCATELFLNDGFERTSMEAVAVRAGVPKTTLYKRFGDKGALLRAVITARVESWSIAASAQNECLTDDLGQRLKHYCALMIVRATTPEVRAFVRLANSIPQDEGDRFSRLDVIGHSKMVDVLENEIRIFGPREKIQVAAPKRVAEALMALLAGWLDRHNISEPFPADEATALASYLVDLMLLGKLAW